MTFDLLFYMECLQYILFGYGAIGVEQTKAIGKKREYHLMFPSWYATIFFPLGITWIKIYILNSLPEMYDHLVFDLICVARFSC